MSPGKSATVVTGFLSPERHTAEANLTDGRDKEYKSRKGVACECLKRQDAFTICKVKNRLVRKESYHSF